jgi:hypothetical protein
MNFKSMVCVCVCVCVFSVKYCARNDVCEWLCSSGEGGGARGSLADCVTMLQAGRSRVLVPIRTLNVFNLPNPSGRTRALEFTQPLTEMSAAGA